MRYSLGRCLLRDILRKRKLPQRQLADMVDRPETQISDYINDRTKMGYTTAVSIALALKIHAEDLYEWIPDRRLGE